MTSTREDLERLSGTAENAGATLLDHGHHVVEMGRKQAEIAAQKGRKQAEAASRRAQRETRAAAKKARKRSAAAWSDFADEASQRASNVIAAGRGEKIVAPRRRRAPLLIGVAGGVVALLFLARARAGRAMQPVPVVPTDLPAAPDIQAPPSEHNGTTPTRARHLN